MVRSRKLLCGAKFQVILEVRFKLIDLLRLTAKEAQKEPVASRGVGPIEPIGLGETIRIGRGKPQPCGARFVYFGEDGVYFGALRSERANGVGRGSVTGEQHRLATAAAEVLRAAVTGFARLLHPIFPTEFLERFGALPDFAQAAALHVFKLQAGNHRRGMAGKRITARSNEHEFAAPAANARLGEFGVVVGHDENDASLAA